MKKSSKVFFCGIGGLFILLMAAMPFKMVDANQKIIRKDTSILSSVETIVGNKKRITKTTALTSFDNVHTSGNFFVTIKTGKTSQISITTDENIMPYVRTEVSDNTLNLDMKPDFAIVSSEKHKAVITSPAIRNITIMGNTNLTADDIKEETLNVTFSGNGEANLAGEVKLLNIELRGNAKINAKDLKAETVNITGAGNLDLIVHATKNLNLKAFGKSDIRYYGNPEINRTAFGLISIQKMDK